MATWKRWSHGVAASALVVAGMTAGCVARSDAPTSSSSGGGYGPSDGANGTGSSSGGSPSAQPMLVVVDTGETFQSSSMRGGQGVGVFVEYQAGGHWAIQWTCDTAITNLNCQFQIGVMLSGATATASVGAEGAEGAEAGSADAITNLASQLQSANGQVSLESSAEVMATSTTYTALDGMTFDTPPGATITVDAQVDGEDSGSFLFFVQDGRVNGGYQGTLTDPLMFQPSTP